MIPFYIKVGYSKESLEEYWNNSFINERTRKVSRTDARISYTDKGSRIKALIVQFRSVLDIKTCCYDKRTFIYTGGVGWERINLGLCAPGQYHR